MKRLLTLFTLSLVLVACETQPVGVDTPDAQFAKVGKGKPDKPDKPGNKPASGELITFTGDLAGGQMVEGCCPNRGPNPEYTMTLSGAFEDISGEDLSGTHTGNIFMNSWAPKRTDYGDYKVHFDWSIESVDYCIVIDGGNNISVKGTKITVVEFDNLNIVNWTIRRNDVVVQTVPPEGVSFTLRREPQ